MAGILADTIDNVFRDDSVSAIFEGENQSSSSANRMAGRLAAASYPHFLPPLQARPDPSAPVSVALAAPGALS